MANILTPELEAFMHETLFNLDENLPDHNIVCIVRNPDGRLGLFTNVFDDDDRLAILRTITDKAEKKLITETE